MSVGYLQLGAQGRERLHELHVGETHGGDVRIRLGIGDLVLWPVAASLLADQIRAVLDEGEPEPVGLSDSERNPSLGRGE